MNDGRGKQLQISSEDKIQVQDCGRTSTPFSRPLSQYLAADLSPRLVNSASPRTQLILDQEILSLDAIIEGLQILRILKCQKRNGYVPISRLPAEILAEIFILVQGNGEKAGQPDVPFVLGRVCSAWRSVAWQHPRLWTNVYCRVLHPSKSKVTAQLLFQWLVRSRNLPVSVKIDFLDESSWASQDEHAPLDILDSLTAFCNQWKALDLVLPPSWQRHLNLLNPLSFSCLEEIQIRPLSPFQDYGMVMEGFFCAPKLHSVSYEAYPLHSLYLPWLNLTQATFTGRPLDEILNLLCRCTDLVICNILDPIPDENVYPVIPVIHKCLKELLIKDNQGAFGALEPSLALSILRLLTAPFLRSVSLRVSNADTNPLDDIQEFIERSHCSLQIVEISGPDLHEAEVIEFLSETSVVHLHNRQIQLV